MGFDEVLYATSLSQTAVQGSKVIKWDGSAWADLVDMPRIPMDLAVYKAN
jgi:hypothetical protein